MRTSGCCGFLLLIALAKSGAAADEFAGWPPGWVETYKRFETFIAGSRVAFPPVDLSITEDGIIIHNVPYVEARDRHLGVEWYLRGALVLTTGQAEKLFNGEASARFGAVTYAVCLHSPTFVGYQHFHPIKWIELSRPSHSASANPPGSGISPTVKMIPPPANGEAAWPNERMLRYLDFHIFRGAHPDAIRSANGSLVPAVALRVNPTGVIIRELLPDRAAESVLVWRVYYNGALIEKDSAANVARLNAGRGPGTYQAWIGVEGSGGFMPVSNLLEFPLFPEKDGTNVLFPTTTREPGLADFLLDIIPPANLPNALTDNSGATPRKMVYDAYRLVEAEPVANETNQRLLELWRAWSWHLNQYRLQPKNAPWILQE